MVSNTSDVLTGFQEWPSFHFFKRSVKKFFFFFAFSFINFICSGSPAFIFVVIVITYTFNYMAFV